MRDFNGDGVEDIYSSTSIPGVQGIDVYRGQEVEGRLEFEKMTFDVGNFDVLQIEVGGSYSPLYSAWTDVPVIADIDGDTDLDILTFEPGGTFLAYYKNTSLEEGLGLDTLVYTWEDPCWGKFRENDISEEVFLSDDPNEVKKKLAMNVVDFFHGDGIGQEMREKFEAVFKKGGVRHVADFQQFLGFNLVLEILMYVLNGFPQWFIFVFTVFFSEKGTGKHFVFFTASQYPED